MTVVAQTVLAALGIDGDTMHAEWSGADLRGTRDAAWLSHMPGDVR